MIVPPLPGVFSAFGLLVADTEHHATPAACACASTKPMHARIASVLDALTAAGAERLARDGFPPERQQFRRAALARYVGQSSEIEVRLPDGDFLPASPNCSARSTNATTAFVRRRMNRWN